MLSTHTETPIVRANGNTVTCSTETLVLLCAVHRHDIGRISFRVTKIHRPGTASTLVVLSLPLARRYLAIARNPVESYYGRRAPADSRAGFVSSRACRGIGNDPAWGVLARALISRSSFSHGAPLNDAFAICRIDSRVRRFYVAGARRSRYRSRVASRR